MNKLKISAYSLLVVSILKIGMLFIPRNLSNKLQELEIRYYELKVNANQLKLFEDSLIYNTEFRSRTLGSKYSRMELDSAIAKNRLDAEQMINKVEVFFEEKKMLERSSNIYNGVDQILDILVVIAIGLTIIFWNKNPSS